MNTDNLTTLNMHLDQNKVLGVNAIPIIKHDILCSMEGWMNIFYDSISDEYRKELLLKLDELWKKFNESSTSDKKQLLDEIHDLYKGQETMQEAINALKNAVKGLELGEDENDNPESVLNPDEVKKILMASLIDRSFWTDEMIGAPTVVGNEIVGLVGLFGKIKAANIQGDVIEGKTVQSFDKGNLIKGTIYERYDSEGNKLENNPYIAYGDDKGPMWQLRQDGDGYLASGRISWDAEGKVTLTDVKLSFNDLEDLPEEFGKGDDGISVFTSTVFIRQNDKPSMPEGGSFIDPLPRKSINDGIKWQDSIPTGDEILWSSTRIFSSDSTSEINQEYWSDPSQMTDTSNFEVIFGIDTADLNNLPELPITDGLNNHFGWYDNDTDITDKEIWYMATATCKNGEWSGWKVSKIKGERGEDGKSVTIKGSFDTLDEFKTQIAGDDLKTPPADNDFSAAYIVEGDLYIWDITESTWKNVGRFNGIDGMSKFKSIVFKRSNEILTERPTGGDWDNPIPEGWEDGIPEGTGIIWMSYRTWYSDDEMNRTIEWSVPKIMQDSNSFDVAYGTAAVKREDGSININGLPVDTNGNANPSDTFMSPWYDEPELIPEGEEIWYMATAECKNDAWSKWTITKIKGEDGKNGTSINIIKSYASIEDFKLDFGENLDVAPEDPSHCYLVRIDDVDHIFVWVSLMKEWTDQGAFSGIPGDDGISQFIHMKYAISLGETDDTNNTPLDYSKIDLTENDGESTVDAKWIGIGKTDSTFNPDGIDPDPKSRMGYIYKWSRIYVDPIITPAKFRSTVFARINENILKSSDVWPDSVKVTGGDWNSPRPVDSKLYGYTITWEDGIPSGNTPIWCTSFTFDSEKDYSTATVEWDVPKLMADNDSFETAYAPESIVIDGVVDETGLPTQNGEIGGLADPSKPFTNGWTDEPESGVDYYYMATAQKSGGTWSNWKVFKIKGEKGERGGSVKLSTAFDTLEKLIEYYSDGINGNNGEPIDAYKENAHIIKKGPIKANTDPIEYYWQNHLFVWVGEQVDDSSAIDGDYFYKGWYDSGQFNGNDGKDGKPGKNAYVHIKYAKSIVYNADGTLNTDKCEATINGGESTKDVRWIGICNNSEENDPIIDKNNASYSAENWSKYNWSEMTPEELIQKSVNTQLGTYHISSNHIAGKTMDTAVDDEGNNTNNYVPLAAGTPYVTFTMGEDGQETQNPIKTAKGDGSKEGPAWQLRTDGDGYVAAGQIQWTKDGSVTLGPNVSLKWNQIPDANSNVSTAINTSNTALKAEITNDINAYKNYNDAAVADLKAKQTTALNDIAKAKTDIENVNKAISDNNTDLNTKISSLNTSLNSATTALESKYNAANTAITNNKTAAEKALSDAKTELNNAISTGKQEAIKAAQDKVDALNDTIENLQQQQEALQKNYNDQQIALNSLKTTVDNLKIEGGAGLDANEVNELIKTAFIDGTYIESDSVTSPNVFTTNLMALVAKFGTVKASNVTSGVIQGSTVQSSVSIDNSGVDSAGVVINPTWKINNDGTGYLANKNISWDKNGKLIANIDGGALGQPNENGDYPFEWDEYNVYINKNLNFADGCGISFSDVSGTLNGTKIENGSISTDQLNVNEVAAKIVEVEKANIQNLVAGSVTAASLNTTPGERKSGTINIESDEINVYGESTDVSNGVRPVLKISGGTTNKPGNAKKDLSFSEFLLNDTSVKNVMNTTRTTGNYLNKSLTITSEYPTKFMSSLGATTLLDENNIVIDSTNLKRPTMNIQFRGNLTGGKELYCVYALVISPTSRYNNAVNESDIVKFLNPLSGEYSHFRQKFTFNTIEETKYVRVYGRFLYFDGKENFYDLAPANNSGYTLPAGTYHVMTVLQITPTKIYGSSQSSSEHIDEINTWNNIYIDYTSQDSAYSYLFRDVNTCIISPEYFTYYVDENKYVEYTEGGAFKFKNGNYSLVVDEKGIGMGFDGIENGAVKQIRPIYKEWKTNGYNIHGYVLTLGEIIETTSN
jgi:hypothetical protein